MIAFHPNPGARRGSVLVESALCLLPLLGLLWGIFDIGFAIFVKNTMSFAVRQGVRYAVTSQTMPGLGHDASIKTRVKECCWDWRTRSAPIVTAWAPSASP